MSGTSIIAQIFVPLNLIFQPINMKISSGSTVGLNVTQVLVMAEDRINNSNFSNIRAITPLLLSNPDRTICA